MLGVNVLADHHGVHDRKDPRAAVIVMLDLLVVWKQPHDVRRAALEAFGNVERKKGHELARGHYACERFPRREKIDLEVGWKIERQQRALRWRIEVANEPMDVVGSDAVVVLQHALDEDEPGRAVLRGADALALEVLRRADVGARPHVHGVMPEDLRQRDGDRHKRALALALEAHIRRERHFRDVEFLRLQHAGERLARPHHLDVEVDAVRLHAPVHEWAGTIVVPAGEREWKIGHRVSWSTGHCDGGSKIMPPRIDKSKKRPCGRVANTGAVGTPAASSMSATQWEQTCRKWKRPTAR